MKCRDIHASCQTERFMLRSESHILVWHDSLNIYVLLFLFFILFPGPEMALAEKSGAVELRPEQIFDAVTIRTFPHDPRAFTEGLLFYNSILFESTGRYGRSELREVDIETGTVKRRFSLEKTLFGEGICAFSGRMVQLTWRAGKGLVYDAASLKQVGSFTYSGEGWGLTFNEKHLVMSNGTDVLRFLDPATFTPVRSVRVHSASRGAVYFLNELEYVNGEIWANVWRKDLIVRINPEDGRVTGWIRLGGLLGDAARTHQEQVFNGIAWDNMKKRLVVAIKSWPLIYEIRLVPCSQAEK